KETEIHFIEPNFFMNLRNTNKLLWNYPYADGVKTGTTNAAGKCLVAAATKDGRQLIAVVLHAPNRFGDAQKLLEWGFQNTQTIDIAQAGDIVEEFNLANGETIGAFVQYPISVTILSKDQEKLEKRTVWTRDSSLPVEAGEELGVYEIWYGEKKIHSEPLIAETSSKLKGRLKGLLEGK
ncbi:MAG: D-alanyl-D-alanine carboxypeptidase, partial [Desulfitobacterium sp.]|nr:D-alanyl-D-alanine carboxypeptidase [Desulfitobacterium sp.]